MQPTVLVASQAGVGLIGMILVMFLPRLLVLAALPAGALGVREHGRVVVAGFDQVAGVVDGTGIAPSRVGFTGPRRVSRAGDFGLNETGLGGRSGDMRWNNVGHGVHMARRVSVTEELASPEGATLAKNEQTINSANPIANQDKQIAGGFFLLLGDRCAFA
ncbi:MAG: hypothetical protein HOP29_01565 [Phycisphaerales bacterium]|nr:hypothetical protein [Phycisphaerales bacterium]